MYVKHPSCQFSMNVWLAVVVMVWEERGAKDVTVREVLIGKWSNELFGVGKGQWQQLPGCLCGFQASYLGSSGRILRVQETVYRWYGPFSALKSCTGGRRSPSSGPDIYCQMGNPSPKYSGFRSAGFPQSLDFFRHLLVFMSVGSG